MHWAGMAASRRGSSYLGLPVARSLEAWRAWVDTRVLACRGGDNINAGLSSCSCVALLQWPLARGAGPLLRPDPGPSHQDGDHDTAAVPVLVLAQESEGPDFRLGHGGGKRVQRRTLHGRTMHDVGAIQAWHTRYS